MGLFRILTFPVSGPVAGTTWVLRTVLEEAERAHYDPVAIRQQMADLEASHHAGSISDEELERREEELLQRLIESRERRQQRAGGA